MDIDEKDLPLYQEGLVLVNDVRTALAAAASAKEEKCCNCNGTIPSHGPHAQRTERRRQQMPQDINIPSCRARVSLTSSAPPPVVSPGGKAEERVVVSSQAPTQEARGTLM